MGDREINDKKRSLIKDTNCPEWFMDYEIMVELPGSSTVRIEVWEHHVLEFDELVGFTEIDCEDRFLNKAW